MASLEKSMGMRTRNAPLHRQKEKQTELASRYSGNTCRCKCIGATAVMAVVWEWASWHLTILQAASGGDRLYEQLLLRSCLVDKSPHGYIGHYAIFQTSQGTVMRLLLSN